MTKLFTSRKKSRRELPNQRLHKISVLPIGKVNLPQIFKVIQIEFQIISLLQSLHVVHPEDNLSPVAQHGQVLQLVVHRSKIVPTPVHHPLARHNHSCPLKTCVRNSGDGGVRSVAAEAWRNGDWLALLILGKY